jgi:hypothetical protein
MKIAFTGHRNRTAENKHLEKLARKYPDALWIHGGAVGFDSQVERIAQQIGIKTLVIKPDYQKHGRKAPLIRNHDIVTGAYALVVLWDGREYGGTFYTMNLAREAGIPIWRLSCLAGHP